jgi:hypothetical protein
MKTSILTEDFLPEVFTTNAMLSLVPGYDTTAGKKHHANPNQSTSLYPDLRRQQRASCIKLLTLIRRVIATTEFIESCLMGGLCSSSYPKEKAKERGKQKRTQRTRSTAPTHHNKASSMFFPKERKTAT